MTRRAIVGFVLMAGVACAAPEATHGVLQVSGGALYYEVAGHGAPVVFVHGGFGDRRMWDDQFAAFAATYRVVRYDLRGFGKSSFPEASYSPVDDLRRVLDHLGIVRAHLVGNSMGGTLILDFALIHPTRVASLTVVSSGPSGFPGTPEEQARFKPDEDAVQAVFNGAAERGAARGVELWAAHPMVKIAAANPTLGPRLRQMISDNAAMFRMEHWPTEHMDRSAVHRLAEIKAPTLVILGDSDTPVVQALARLAATGISAAQLVVIANADHLPHMERVEEFDRTLRAFLER